MTTTLSEGVKVPDVGSVNWAGDLEVNWNLLNGALANLSGNVKLDRDNTWTGEQSFTLPIVGSITGTASKAIADEDGTSIKTGYGKLAGNQTWSGENLYTSNLNVSGFRIRLYDSTDDWTVTPTNTVIKEIDFTDKNNSVISYFAFQHRSNTTEPFRTCWRQNKKDGTTDYYSVNFNNLGEFYPEISNTKLGTSSNRWSSVYADSYYYGTTAFTDKFVTTDTNQEIGGTKTFTGSIRPYGLITHLNQGLEKGAIPSANKYGGIIYNDKTFANNLTHRFADQVATVAPDGTTAIWLSAYKWETNGIAKAEVLLNYPLSGKRQFRIDVDEIVPLTTAVTDLGTSTNKWKTINGYEPSMLGEVWVDNAVTIDTTNWLLDGSGWNTLNTSIMSGWFYFAVTDCDADSFILFRRGSNKAKNPTICFHPQHANSGTYYLYGLFMVPKNTTCIIAIKTGTNGVLSQALLYPCFGNV